jgi:ABC-type transport system involved in cytochrome bd biosynthesis fused ATPase/permease subunit
MATSQALPDSASEATPVVPAATATTTASQALPASAALVLENLSVKNAAGQEIGLPNLATRAGRISVVPVRPDQATALLGLLSGNLKPASGMATLGKVSLNEIAAFPLRKRISFLSPSLPLVGETVLEAISYSRDKSARLAAEQMLALCQEDLPQAEHLQLDDRLKDHGQYLSETQRFRLQAARMLLTGKRMLVLDLPSDLVDHSALEHFGTLLKRYLLEHKASAVVLERSAHSPLKEMMDTAS